MDKRQLLLCAVREKRPKARATVIPHRTVLVTSMPTSTPLRSFSDSSSQTFFSFSLISVFIFLLFITLIY